MTKSQFIAEIYLQLIKDKMRHDIIICNDRRRIIANAAREEADLAEQYIQFDSDTSISQ